MVESKTKNKIESFADLHAWREAHQLVLMVYKASKEFPQEERFGLTNQVRRAAVSITSNIAEGFSRQPAKEKLQFYSMSKGSNTELQNQLLVARDIGYISSSLFQETANQSMKVSKLLTGLMRYCRE